MYLSLWKIQFIKDHKKKKIKKKKRKERVCVLFIWNIRFNVSSIRKDGSQNALAGPLGCELKARATNTQIEKLFSFTIASVIEQ
jgi:hypothetical protein